MASEEKCNIFVDTCGNERHFYASLGLRPGIQRRYVTIGADWINAMRSGGCNRSKVPLIVSVQRVVAYLLKPVALLLKPRFTPSLKPPKS